MKSKIVAYSFVSGFALFNLVHPTAKATDIVVKAFGSGYYGAAQVLAAVDASSDTEFIIKYRATRDLAHKMHHTFIATENLNDRLEITGGISPRTMESTSVSAPII